MMGFEIDEAVAVASPKAGLPFVNGQNFWAVKPTGAYADDVKQGRAYAQVLLDRMVTEDAPMLLGRVTHAMIASGFYGGIEIGFTQVIAEAAVRGRR